jgi:hypothetical protein
VSFRGVDVASAAVRSVPTEKMARDRGCRTARQFSALRESGEKGPTRTWRIGSGKMVSRRTSAASLSGDKGEAGEKMVSFPAKEAVTSFEAPSRAWSRFATASDPGPCSPDNGDDQHAWVVNMLSGEAEMKSEYGI